MSGEHSLPDLQTATCPHMAFPPASKHRERAFPTFLIRPSVLYDSGPTLVTTFNLN